MIRKIVALLLLTAWTSWACAQDHLRDTTYWEDPTGGPRFLAMLTHKLRTPSPSSAWR